MKKHKLAKELSDMVNYFVSRRFEDFPSSQSKRMYLTRTYTTVVRQLTLQVISCYMMLIFVLVGIHSDVLKNTAGVYMGKWNSVDKLRMAVCSYPFSGTI